MRFKNLGKAVAGAALGLTLAFTSVTPALAATITITNTTADESYAAYKLFDVSHPEGTTHYSYSTTNKSLKEYLERLGLTFTTSADGSTYYVNSQGAGDDAKFVTSDGTMTAAELASKLHDTVGDLGKVVIPAAQETVSGDAGQIVLGDGEGAGDAKLDKGYYFVTSTVGSLCFLQTSDSDLTIKEKNEAPEVEKSVETQEDNATVEVGDSLTYTIDVTIQPGAENYVLHDIMSDGLTLNKGVAVTVGGSPLDTKNYSVQYADESELVDEDEGCVFEVHFNQDYLNSITTSTDVVVTYTATVNANAATGDNDPITNQAVLNYGDNSKVETDEGKADVYTYDFKLEKTDQATSEPLTGAQFKLYDQEDGVTPIEFVKVGDDVYRVATQSEIDDPATVTTDTIEAGSVTIKGLAGKTYYLEETQAPAGYNKLPNRQAVNFIEKDTLADSDLADQIVPNSSGSLLPSTGGMGTTALYVVGAVLVVGAGVTLVVRRRAQHEA